MPKYWLIGGATLATLLVAASVVVALTREVEQLPRDTPEGTVQLYLTALGKEDFGLAHGLLSARLKRECGIEDFASQRQLRMSRELEDSRVTLEGTRSLNGKVIVTGRFTRIRGSGPFGTSESSHEQLYTLAQEESEWRLSEYSWPHFGCGPVAGKSFGVESRPEGTPEGTVGRFLEAVGAEDLNGAYSHLSEDMRTTCPYERFVAGGTGGAQVIRESQLAFDPTTFDKGTAFVAARLVNRSAGRGDSSFFSLTFTLHQEQGWRFTEYPWPYSDCGRSVFASEAR